MALVTVALVQIVAEPQRGDGDAVELDAALFVLAFAEQLAGFREQVGHQVFLEVVEVLDGRAVLFEELGRRLWGQDPK